MRVRFSPTVFSTPLPHRNRSLPRVSVVRPPQKVDLNPITTLGSVHVLVFVLLPSPRSLPSRLPEGSLPSRSFPSRFPPVSTGGSGSHFIVSHPVTSSGYIRLFRFVLALRPFMDPGSSRSDHQRHPSVSPNFLDHPTVLRTNTTEV